MPPAHPPIATGIAPASEPPPPSLTPPLLELLVEPPSLVEPLLELALVDPLLDPLDDVEPEPLAEPLLELLPVPPLLLLVLTGLPLLLPELVSPGPELPVPELPVPELLLAPLLLLLVLPVLGGVCVVSEPQWAARATEAKQPKAKYDRRKFMCFP